jgi:hypothetical protein
MAHGTGEFSIVDEDDGGPTVYDKLGTLCSEIEGQIKTVAGQSQEIDRSIEWMRREAFKESSPEAEYAIRLFMKYVDEANAAKLRAAGGALDSRSDAGDSVSLIGDIPDYL